MHFFREEQTAVPSFLLWQPTIPIHQLTDQVTSIYWAPAACRTLSQIWCSNCGCSHVSFCVLVRGCISRLCLPLFTSILLESQFNSIHFNSVQHKISIKETEGGFSYIIFSPAYPINMNYSNSTSRKHYFHREIKRKLSYSCLLLPGFLKTTCRGTRVPWGSNKSCAYYPSSPGGLCQAAAGRSAFLYPWLTLPWKHLEFLIWFTCHAQLGKEQKCDFLQIVQLTLRQN